MLIVPKTQLWREHTPRFSQTDWQRRGHVLTFIWAAVAPITCSFSCLIHTFHWESGTLKPPHRCLSAHVTRQHGFLVTGWPWPRASVRATAGFHQPHGGGTARRGTQIWQNGLCVLQGLGFRAGYVKLDQTTEHTCWSISLCAPEQKYQGTFSEDRDTFFTPKQPNN